MRRTWGLPLLSKELLEQAARRRTYIIRTLYAALLFFAALLVFYFSVYQQYTSPLDILGRGREVFNNVTALQVAGIFLFMPAITCSVITAEKERNTFGLPGASGVETIVEYTVGIAPPIELQMAAADLADELKRACSGDSCALDPRVQSFARRGVHVELTDLEKLLKSGATGIPSVDHALKVHGNCAGGSATMLDPAAPMRGQRVT